MRWDFDDGDVSAAAAQAAVIVEGRYSSPQAAPVPFETHIVSASFDPDDDLTVRSPVHMVFMQKGCRRRGSCVDSAQDHTTGGPT